MDWIKSWFFFKRRDPIKEEFRLVRKKFETRLKENSELEKGAFMEKLHKLIEAKPTKE